MSCRPRPFSLPPPTFCFSVLPSLDHKFFCSRYVPKEASLRTRRMRASVRGAGFGTRFTCSLGRCRRSCKPSTLLQKSDNTMSSLTRYTCSRSSTWERYPRDRSSSSARNLTDPWFRRLAASASRRSSLLAEYAPLGYHESPSRAQVDAWRPSGGASARAKSTRLTSLPPR